MIELNKFYALVFFCFCFFNMCRVQSQLVLKIYILFKINLPYVFQKLLVYCVDVKMREILCHFCCLV